MAAYARTTLCVALRVPLLRPAAGYLARSYRATPALRHLSPESVRATAADVPFTVVDRGGRSHAVVGKEGDNLMYLAHKLQETNPAIVIEGACEASLACSTCHVMISSAHFELLDEPSEVEDDMLDQAPCLTPTSRLGCQITITPELAGMVVSLPKFTRNFYVDGHVPEPH
ncbi:2Fe-2S ferredoxin-type domain-containing protein [Pavlovales sp. CCMP2436]|nr:2Fe-2S ferredoxin-type domain-containing protein [Pavlovales sp. CCMP2436]